MALYEVELVRHRYYRVPVEADSLADAIAAAQDGAGEDDAELMYDGDEELTETMGLPAFGLRDDLAVAGNAGVFAIARGVVSGVFAAYPVALDASDTLTLRGSHGSFQCDGRTGAVWSSGTTPLPDEYATITRVDVAEYEAWCVANGIPPDNETDILLVGYWYGGDNITAAAQYEPPEAQARAICLAERGAS